MKYAQRYANWLRKHARDLDADAPGKLDLKVACIQQAANVIDMLLDLVKDSQPAEDDGPVGALPPAPLAPPHPVAVVAPDGPTVRLQWASVWAAHNARPGLLFAAPVAEMAMVEQILKDFNVRYTDEGTWTLEVRRPPYAGRSGESLWSGTDLRTVAAEAYLDLLG